MVSNDDDVMLMKKISTVIFDLGRVLVSIDFDAFPNALGLTTPESRMPFAAEAARAAHLYETGRLSTDEFLDRLQAIFGSRYTREQLRFAWDEIIREDIPGMAGLIRRVMPRAGTAMLSNTSASHFEKAVRTCTTVQMITRRFLSFELGVSKPDPIIYRRVIEDLCVPPGELLFIDDLAENIAGAEAAGMKGIVYTDIRSLESALAERNLLSPSLP